MLFLKILKRKLKTYAHRIANFTADVIYDRADGFTAVLYGSLLYCLSFAFEAIARLRFYLYNKRILRDAPLGCMVVVVGNLTVGGTGKTPIVEKFARSLADRGRKVAILSRGYKSKSDSAARKILRWFTHGESPKPRVVSDGKNVLLDSSVAGDEPYMLARNLPDIIVIVDKNRVRAGHYAITHFGADTLVLDDGFQYLPLKGQLQLLLVDKTNPFGNKRLLPRGILREPISHLNRASYIFLTKSDGEKDFELEQVIRKYNKTAEIIECEHKLRALVDFSSGEKSPLDILRGKKIACFCAIAAPESFERFLRELGAQLVFKKRFLDHHRFSKAELDDFFARTKAAGAEFAVTTEKDSVRICADFKPPIPFFYSKLEINILSGEGDFETAVDRICFPKRRADSGERGAI